MAPAAKDQARENAHNWLRAGNLAMVRINSAGTPWHEEDVRMVSKYGSAVMLPKAEAGDVIPRIASIAADIDVVALIETATAATVAAQPNVTRLAFASIDRAAELGVDPTTAKRCCWPGRPWSWLRHSPACPRRSTV